MMDIPRRGRLLTLIHINASGLPTELCFYISHTNFNIKIFIITTFFYFSPKFIAKNKKLAIINIGITTKEIKLKYFISPFSCFPKAIIPNENPIK
jgi:hypothetical protein